MKKSGINSATEVAAIKVNCLLEDLNFELWLVLKKLHVYFTGITLSLIHLMHVVLVLHCNSVLRAAVQVGAHRIFTVKFTTRADM
jgi:hypothetical protein